MARLIRMDETGHTTLEWGVDDPAGYGAASQELQRALEDGYIAVVDHGGGKASQVSELPPEAELVIMRRPIAGG